MNEKELFDVIYYIMKHNIKNAKILFFDNKVGVMYNYSLSSFNRGTGYIDTEYTSIMEVLEILSKQQESREDFRKLFR